MCFISAERRKTWSGTSLKPESETQQQHAETDDEHHGDSNNNSFNNPQDNYHSPKNNQLPTSDSYTHNTYNSFRADDFDQNQYSTNESTYTTEDNPYSREDNPYSREDNSYAREDNSYSREDNSDYYSRGDNSDLYSGTNGDIYGLDSSGRPRYLDNMYNSAMYAERPNFRI